MCTNEEREEGGQSGLICRELQFGVVKESWEERNSEE